MVEDIVIVGGGGHAKVVAAMLAAMPRYQIVGYVDLKDRGPLLGAPFIGDDALLISLARKQQGLHVVIGVGQVGLGMHRSALWQRLQAVHVSFPTIIAENAVVSPAARCAEACTIMPGAVLNPDATIGIGCILNSNCTVEHDVMLGDWVHIAPGATVCGDVQIGRHSMIGAGATVIEGVKVSHDCLIGAGATVIHSIHEPGTYVGSPARRIR